MNQLASVFLHLHSSPHSIHCLSPICRKGLESKQQVVRQQAVGGSTKQQLVCKWALINDCCRRHILQVVVTDDWPAQHDG